MLAHRYVPSRQNNKKTVFLLCATALVFLQYAWRTTDYRSPTILALASILLVLCLIPLCKHLLDGTNHIPFIPLLFLVHGLYFALPPLLPFEYHFTFWHVSESAQCTYLVLTIGGVIALYSAYYGSERFRWLRLLPQYRAVQIAADRGASIGMTLGILGLILYFLTSSSSIPVTIRSAIDFINQFSLLGMILLFKLQLENSLAKSQVIFLWLLLIPAQILIDINTGLLYQMFRDGFILLLVYVSIRRKLPILAMTIGITISTLLLLAKPEYRRVTWDYYYDRNDPVTQSLLYFDIIRDLPLGDRQATLDGLQEIAYRINNGIVFAYVIDATPRWVPYWNGATYSTIFVKFIPRILWPDKPQEVLGQGFGHRYRLLDPNNTTTSFNFPLIVEMYANFGSLGVIFGMALLGIIYRMVTYTLNLQNSNEWAFVVSILIYSGLLQIDSNFLLIFGNLAYRLILLNYLGVFFFSKSNPDHQSQLSTGSSLRVK